VRKGLIVFKGNKRDLTEIFKDERFMRLYIILYDITVRNSKITRLFFLFK